MRTDSLNALRRFTSIALTIMAILVASALGLIIVATFLDGLDLRGGLVGELVRRVAYRLIDILPSVLLIAWVGFFGSSIGSFLNVVVYRMPRNESVAARASHCPRCDASILARDNVPIFGWLLLGGRCRNCRLAVSARYPIVEFVSGAITLVLFTVEIARNGSNLPFFDDPGWTLIPLFAFELPLKLMACLGLHLWAVLGLLACGLIRLDGKQIPVRLVGILVLGTTLMPILIPSSLAVAAWPENSRLDAVVRSGSATAIAQAAFNLMVGVIAGGLVGTAKYWDKIGVVRIRTDHSLVVGGILSATAMGWQSVLAIGVFYSIALTGFRFLHPNNRRFKKESGALLTSAHGNSRPKQLLLFCALTVIWLVFWRVSTDFGSAFLPGPQTPLWQVPLWMLAVSLPLLVSLLIPARWPEYSTAEDSTNLFERVVSVEVAADQSPEGNQPVSAQDLSESDSPDPSSPA